MKKVLSVIIISLLLGVFISIPVIARTAAEVQEIMDRLELKQRSVPTYKELIEMTDKDFKEAVDNMGGGELSMMMKEVANLIVIKMKAQGLDRKVLKTIFSDRRGADIRLRKEMAKAADVILRPIFGKVLDKIMLDILINDLSYEIVDRLKTYMITGV